MRKLALLSILLGLLALVFVPTLLKNHGIYLFTYWLIYVIAAMGLNLTVGYAGQKSLVGPRGAGVVRGAAAVLRAAVPLGSVRDGRGAVVRRRAGRNSEDREQG